MATFQYKNMATLLNWLLYKFFVIVLFLFICRICCCCCYYRHVHFVLFCGGFFSLLFSFDRFVFKRLCCCMTGFVLLLVTAGAVLLVVRCKRSSFIHILFACCFCFCFESYGTDDNVRGSLYCFALEPV